MLNFKETSNHISSYRSNNSTISIFKKEESLSYSLLTIQKLNFDNCFNKIKEELEIDEDLIILLQTEKEGTGNNNNDYIKSLSIYDPSNGQKILFNDTCKDEKVTIEKSLDESIPNKDDFWI